MPGHVHVLIPGHLPQLVNAASQHDGQGSPLSPSVHPFWALPGLTGTRMVRGLPKERFSAQEPGV